MILQKTITLGAISLTALGLFTAKTADSTGLGTLGAFVAFVAGCATIYKILLKPGYLMFKKMQKMFETVERIDKEFSPNSGTSMKDTLNRIEARQMKSEQRQKVLLLDSDDLVYETDPKGETTWVNRTYTKTVDRGMDELKGKGWIVCIHPEDKEKVLEEWESCVDQSRDFDMNFKMISRNGEIMVNSKAHPLIDDLGRVIGYLGQTVILN